MATLSPEWLWFLVGVAVVRWYFVARGKEATIVAVMIWFGALAVVAAAALGWLYASNSDYFGGEYFHPRASQAKNKLGPLPPITAQA